jgi:hypothetical protein
MDNIDRAQLILAGYCSECLAAPGDEHEHECSKESEESKLTYYLGEQIRTQIDQDLLESLMQVANDSSK